jgi:hypothetical protein
MNDELARKRQEADWPNLRYYLRYICLEKLRKTMRSKIIIQAANVVVDWLALLLQFSVNNVSLYKNILRSLT